MFEHFILCLRHPFTFLIPEELIQLLNLYKKCYPVKFSFQNVA